MVFLDRPSGVRLTDILALLAVRPGLLRTPMLQCGQNDLMLQTSFPFTIQFRA